MHNEFYMPLLLILYFTLESCMSDISNQNAKHLTNFSRADQTINVKPHGQIHIIPSSF